MGSNAEASFLTNIARAAFGIGICTTIVNSSLYTVGGGQRAVLFDRFRGVLEHTVGEGTHFFVPWLQKPYIFDIRMRPHTFSSISGTKDLQMVNLTLRVLSRPEVNSLPDIFKTLGLEYDDKVLPSIGSEVLKAVVAQFNADQLLTEHPHVSALVRESLIRRAKDFNIVLDDVAITHLSYGAEFSKAVEQKQVAQQEAERSRNGNVIYLPSNNLAFPLNCSLRKSHMEINNESVSRGALIVLEGLDRCGKTSQCGRLLSYLEELEYPVESWRFPDRDTGVGQMISSYLSNKSHLDDRAIHLLFSANRWEKRSLMESKLRSGTTLIIDRYSFSGVAFSSAKGLDVEWCKAPETGLLAPDLVVYLDISPEEAAKRGGYGGERYEQLEFQKRVAQSYKALSDATWKIIDATLPIEDVEKQLKQNVMECMLTCRKGKPFSELWQN